MTTIERKIDRLERKVDALLEALTTQTKRASKKTIKIDMTKEQMRRKIRNGLLKKSK